MCIRCQTKQALNEAQPQTSLHDRWDIDNHDTMDIPKFSALSHQGVTDTDHDAKQIGPADNHK